MANNRKEDFLASEIEKDLENMAVSEDISAETEEKDNKSEEKKQSKIKEILHSRKFARGWLFVAVIAVFLACVIAVNIIASVLESNPASATSLA